MVLTKTFNVGCSSCYEHATYFNMEDLFSYHKQYGFVQYKIIRKHVISEKTRKLILWKNHDWSLQCLALSAVQPIYMQSDKWARNLERELQIVFLHT